MRTIANQAKLTRTFVNQATLTRTLANQAKLTRTFVNQQELSKRISTDMKRIIITALIGLGLVISASAQPAKSRIAENAARSGAKTGTKAGAKTSNQATSRASLMFPTSVNMPEDVVWRRDIYRELDLRKDENAPLYYPVEPTDGRVNLFTVLFQLLNVGKIPAYVYDINGTENFTKENRMHFKDMLDRYEIPYEIEGNSIKVDQSRIPSEEVLSYFVKESNYFDQNTATYHSRVVAICPVLHRNADIFTMGDEEGSTKYPLFWVKIEDIEPYLSQHMVMTSNINNAATMSMADFFDTNQYKGKIYMTTNMQGKSLAQTAASDSALVKEQKHIEKQMKDFEGHIWATPVDSAELAKRDSIAAAEASSKKAKKTTTRTSRTAARSSSKAEKSSKSSSSSGSAAPRVSVRRQRH